MTRLMAAVEAEVAGWGAECEGCGRCCEFGGGAFVLFASSVEVAWLLSHARPRRVEAGRCPFHEDGRCAVRPWRPLGCRLYFCRLGAASERYEIYEGFEQRLREVADELRLEWCYAPFLELLAQASARGGIRR
jgi:Fe-S-cluster containining protein